MHQLLPPSHLRLLDLQTSAQLCSLPLQFTGLCKGLVYAFGDLGFLLHLLACLASETTQMEEYYHCWVQEQFMESMWTKSIRISIGAVVLLLRTLHPLSNCN